ncbi:MULTISPECIES: ABCB family ABC transporter ATP-binding protein/permease [unclassified Xanthobacter]|uniref:ABCB family ABC transporter ATP-binding protein/permease n=1 Tax=unclassified Xanthobacter TaxID=2623496 RepID=UPI001EE02175|nr:MULTISPECIES: ABC transporter ATP-binding protein/permease [unclassified Xanthobacter]
MFFSFFAKAAKDPSAAGPRDRFLGTLEALWPYLWPQDRADLRLRVVVTLLLLFGSKGATMVVPFVFKWATDALTAEVNGTPTPTGWAYILGAPVALTLAYGIARIVMAAVTQVRDGIFAKVALHAVRKLAIRTFRHMHELSLRFHLERKTGGLTRVLERARNGIETIVRMLVLQLAPTIVELAMVLAVLLFAFDWRYVAVLVVTVAAYAVFTYRASEWRLNIRKEMNDSDTEANTKAVDSLLNYETVKYFSAEAWENARYDRSMARYEQATVQTFTSLAWLNAGQAIIYSLGLTAVMVLCVLDIRAGRQTVGSFVMINAMMIQLYVPLNFLGFIYREIKQALLDIETMFAVLARAPEIVDRPGAPDLVVSGGTVRFEDVRFAYEPGREILKGVSFEVPAGRTVAIVGASGAGKSTLSRLLFRFYDVSSGRIVIDGQDIRDVSQASLRRAIGMVPQDTVLFNDTIAYNIRYGRQDASEDEVRAAARMARIDDFIQATPKGYKTEVGERGLKLSGGEKQRVAIARTLLKAPPILVLDEATSALDSRTEKDIQDALDRVSEGRTTLVIAHRLSTVIGADEILVMDAGRVAERGSHAALLALGGLYAGLWQRQQEAEAAAGADTVTTKDDDAPDDLAPGRVEDEMAGFNENASTALG